MPTAPKREKQPNRYVAILEYIFDRAYEKGATKIAFTRPDIEKAAKALKISLPKNLGDLVYTFRYRSEMPTSMKARAPKNSVWIIRAAGRAKYEFCVIDEAVANVAPNRALIQTLIPDATPGIIARYAKTDEQAVLARLRYNRLVDIFSGVTCYSLQNHYRTTVQGMGQVETDELYIGLDRAGAHYVFPVQAKGGKDRISIVQIEQDVALCGEKFPDAICRPIAAQFMDGDVIAMFEFVTTTSAGIKLRTERHYKLVPHEKLTAEDLARYRALADKE